MERGSAWACRGRPVASRVTQGPEGRLQGCLSFSAFLETACVDKDLRVSDLHSLRLTQSAGPCRGRKLFGGIPQPSRWGKRRQQRERETEKRGNQGLARVAWGLRQRNWVFGGNLEGADWGTRKADFRVEAARRQSKQESRAQRRREIWIVHHAAKVPVRHISSELLGKGGWG